jgi:hypothetical protein
MMKRLIGRMEDYGLPKPDHKILEAHPTVSGEFLTRVKCGDVLIKPAISRLDGTHVEFADGSREPVDVIVYATGYKISFPFFDDPALLPDADNRFPLFKRMIKPDVPNLYFMGLAQPLPTLVNFAEQQSKLVAGMIAGRYLPPSQAEMQTIIARDEAMHLGAYSKAARHTIQVDFNLHVRDLLKEVARGEARAKQGGVKTAA